LLYEVDEVVGKILEFYYIFPELFNILDSYVMGLDQKPDEVVAT
jgi:hypothetical protein